MREGGPVRKEAYTPESETLKTHEIHEVTDDQILGEALPPKLPERVKDEDIIGEVLPPPLPKKKNTPPPLPSKEIPMADDKDVIDISSLPDRTRDAIPVDDLKDALDDAIDRVDDLGEVKRTNAQKRDAAIDAAVKKIDEIFTDKKAA